jgi:hypothetical protein
MIASKKNRPYFIAIGISTVLIILNILLFLFYWINNGLNPNSSTIEEYAIVNNDPSVCRLAYSPLGCLHNLANAEFRTWNYNLGHPDLGILNEILSECTQINNTDIRLLCELNKKQNFSIYECKKIKNRNALNDCVKEAALLSKNANICENVIATLQPYNFTNADRKKTQKVILRGCLERIGVVTKDLSVCDRLDSYQREICIRKIKYSI